MRRFIISVVLIVALAVLALPPIFGVLSERQIKQQLAAGGDNPNVVVDIDRYQRGWYRSTATLQVRPTPAYLATLEKTLMPAADGADDAERSRQELLALLAQGCDLDVDLMHGPIGMHQRQPFVGLASMRGRVGSGTPGLAEIQQMLGVPYLLRVSALLGFGGSTAFAGDVPEFHMAHDDMTADFAGLDVAGRVAARDQDVQLHMRIRPGSYRDDDTVAMLAESEVSFAGQLLADEVWVGDARVQLAAFSLAPVGSAEDALLELAELDVRSDARLNEGEDQVSTTLSVTMDRLQGSALPIIEDVHIDAQIERLGRQALLGYAAAARRLGGASADQMDAASAEFADAVHRLLAGSPVLTLAPLRFTVDGDAVDADLALSVVPEMLPPAAQLFAGDPASWVRLFTGSGRFSVAEPLVFRVAEDVALSQLQASVPPGSGVSDEQLRLLAAQQSQMAIAALLQQGMLVKNDGNIVSELDYGDGAIVINGVTLPLSLR